MEEALRTGGGAVLLVDVAVEVAFVGAGDQLRGGGEVAFVPAPQFHTGRHGNIARTSGRSAVAESRVSAWQQWPLHEDALVNLETLILEDALMRGVGVQQELRFDARDAGRVLEHFQQAYQQLVANLGGRLSGIGAGFARGHGKDVADDGLVAFVNTEDVADDASILDGYVARQNAGVEILEKELGGAAIIPVQALAPYAAFLFQQRAQAARREVAQV